ncbi:MAG: Asp-tRNA(Asn)/Glu-tRNA(Gln) amidotransferase subunit GatC [Patescibacteria group bacterium]
MDKADIEKLFRLARIEVTSQELERFPSEIDSILAYVAELSRADVAHVSPMLSMAPAANMNRIDESKDVNEEIQEAIISQLPDTKDGYLKTRKVFGENV